MQAKSNKDIQILNNIGVVIRDLRNGNKESYSLNTLANSFEIHKGTLSKIENAKQNTGILTIWKIANALGMKCSEFIKLVEDKLGEDFTLIDE